MKWVESTTATRTRRLLAGFALAGLGGCATFSQDGGFSPVESTAKARLNKEVHWIKSDADADTAQAMVKTLLANPLSADDAVQVALLNNRGLQATYAELGIAEADLVQAGRLSNPHFAYLHVRSSEELKIERALTGAHGAFGGGFLDLVGQLGERFVDAHPLDESHLGFTSDVLRDHFPRHADARSHVVQGEAAGVFDLQQSAADIG